MTIAQQAQDRSLGASALMEKREDRFILSVCPAPVKGLLSSQYKAAWDDFSSAASRALITRLIISSTFARSG
jgi:hypothetical protein